LPLEKDEIIKGPMMRWRSIVFGFIFQDSQVQLKKIFDSLEGSTKTEFYFFSLICKLGS
jgi:hypothetical protein